METIRNGGLHSASQHTPFVDKANVYPPHCSYIGLRLDSLGDGHVTRPLGLLLIMDSEPMSADQQNLASHILKAVALRSVRELERIQKEEKLQQAKEAATRDAERKLKFLADMSHEIRFYKKQPMCVQQ